MTSRSVMVGAAAALAAADLGQKAFEPVYGHPRSLVYAAGALAIAAAIVAFVPRVPSRTLTAAGALAVAGALGDGLSALLWRGGVPNPIVAGEVAFNVADVCAVLGAIGLVCASVLFAVRNPHLLREPV
jgi:lipoprotein signal peptidase